MRRPTGKRPGKKLSENAVCVYIRGRGSTYISGYRVHKMPCTCTHGRRGLVTCDLSLYKRHKSNSESRAMRLILPRPARNAVSGCKKIHPFRIAARKNSETRSSLPPRVRNDAVCYFFQLPSFAPLRVFVFLNIARMRYFRDIFGDISNLCH